MSQSEPPLSYLLECSRTSLQGFCIARRNASANLRKTLIKMLNKWVDEEAEARFSELLLEHGEELFALGSGETKPEVIELETPKPLTLQPPERLINWQGARCWRKRAG